MYKIIIADDDLDIRTGLCKMIENAFPDKLIVYRAQNGKDAYEQIIKLNINMIVTDIKMPVWTGLDLIHNLSNINIKIPTIVLSGFDDYNLVRSALKQGAIDYLLKPISEDILISTIETMLQTLELEKIPKLQNINKTFEKQILLEQFLDSSLVNEELIQDFKKKHQISDETFCALMYIDLSRSINLERTKQKIYFEYLLESSFPILEINNQFVYGEIGDYWAMLILFDEKQPMGIRTLKEYSEQLIQEGYKVSLAGKPYELKNLSILKVECTKGLEKYYYDLPMKNIVYEDYKRKAQEKLDCFIESMIVYDYGQAIKFLTETLQIYNEYTPSISYFQKVLSNIIYTIMEKNAVYIGIIGRTKFTEYDILEQIENSQSIAILQNKLIETLNFYIQAALESLENRDDFVIRKAKEYIGKYYHEEITLSDVAANVYLNPSYFSTLFKNKTGTNFSHYLRNSRVEKAKILLQDGEYKIYEIAKKVGYKEATHFVRAFKEVTGKSPNEFRKIS